MSRIIDARGLTCPQPVILTKRVMDENSEEELITLVDNPTAVENVRKLAANQGYICTVEAEGNQYKLHLAKDISSSCDVVEISPEAAILIKSRYFGEGSDELGAVLMKGFIYTLLEAELPVRCIMLMNSGVFLAAEGSPVLEHLQALEEKGVKILSCGTCLDYFVLKDKLRVGEVTNMFNILDNLSRSPKPLIF